MSDYDHGFTPTVGGCYIAKDPDPGSNERTKVKRALNIVLELDTDKRRTRGYAKTIPCSNGSDLGAVTGDVDIGRGPNTKRGSVKPEIPVKCIELLPWLSQVPRVDGIWTFEVSATSFDVSKPSSRTYMFVPKPSVGSE